MTDLSSHIERRRLVARIEADVDAFCRREFAEPPRKHLGASIIGHPCKAYGWNVFRWLKQEAFDGRMFRLFNRGHTEEARFVRWLQGAGFEVRELDPETGKQFRISGVKGHFGGSLDGLAKAPPEYGIPDVLLLEFKTHSNKSFTSLTEKGVARAKPQHFRQMSSYGRAYSLKFGLYVAVNKDNDALHFELVELDWRLADELFQKAEEIISSPQRPQKIANTPTFAECKWCPFAGLCHGNEVPEVNCRSCRQAEPVEGGEWFCHVHAAIIPADVIPGACPSYARIA